MQLMIVNHLPFLLLLLLLLLRDWISLILSSRNLTAWRRALRDSWAFKYLFFHCESNQIVLIKKKGEELNEW